MALPTRPLPQRAPARIPALDTAGVLPLPDWARELAPEPVRAASDAHAEALARLERLRNESHEAQAAAEQAAEHDRQAASTAVAAGKDVPTPKRHKAQAAAERAAEAVAAAADLARTSQDEYIRAVNVGREPLLRAAEEARAATVAEGERITQELEQTLGSLTDLRTLTRALRFLTPPTRRDQDFAVKRNRRGPLAPEQRELVESVRAELGAWAED